MLRVCAVLAGLFVVVLLVAATPVTAAEVFGARFPTLSPDGSTVVFEYWGDLWEAPVDGGREARRITDHRAFEKHPRYSPDGREIAYVSNRNGHDNIWVMPASGGVSRQITNFSEGLTLCGWSPDGKWLVYTSRRDLWAQDVFYIDPSGEKPAQQVTYKDHYSAREAVKLADGGWVYSRGGGRWWRKHYRGSSQTDLWRIAPNGSNVRLTDHPGYDRWPMLDSTGSSILFVSDRDGIDNIWSLYLADNTQSQITFFKDDGVQFPCLTPGGSEIVFEFGGDIYITGVDGGKPRKLDLRIASEAKDNLVVKRTFDNEADEFAVSPHGKYVVFVHEGDLWAVKDPDEYKDDDKPDQDLSRAWRLTSTDDARERDPEFAGDSRHIAYSSDEDGDYEIYVMDLLDQSVTQVTSNEANDFGAVFDPADENVLFYFSGLDRLVRHELETGKINTVATGSFRGAFNYYEFAVSPDGKWVVYSDEYPGWNMEQFIIDSAGEMEPVNISRSPGFDYFAHWSGDGRYLVFTSDRDERSHWYALELDPEPEKYDLNLMFEDDMETGDDEDEADVEENGEAAEEESTDEPNDTEDAEDEDKPLVTIDFDEIHLRAKRVSFRGRMRDAFVDNDGQWLVYEVKPDGQGWEVWAVKTDGSENHKVRDGELQQPRIAKDGKRIYYLDRGGIRYVNYSKGDLKGGERIDARGEFWLDQRLRWRQMYREGWRTLKEKFYDEDMHGTDWPAVYRKYEPYLDHIGTAEEFEFMFQEMLGELNASHLGIYMDEKSYSTPGKATSHLGLEFDESFDGPGLRISHITHNGPADAPGIDLEPGEVVIRIGGTEVGQAMRWRDLLDDCAGRPVRLDILDTAGQEREVVLKPIRYNQYLELVYREWEMANEQLVEELSGGRIGYIHIDAMMGSELDKFKREFISDHYDKDALLVDVRFNPGGYIHEELFNLLDRAVFGYATTRGRDRELQPGYAFNKPKALLINASSGSDAEIFPTGWRNLGLGPIIGIDTGGAVIGTSSFRLIDGTTVRLPINGWFDLDGRNLENNGTLPDVYIDVHPDDLREGRDVQLIKAVEVLMEMID